MPIAGKQSGAVFDKLSRDLRRLRSKPRSENVHGVRTGIRRVEILLQELAPESQPRHKKLLRLLRILRKRAGKVRDLDVQLTALRTFKTARQPRRKTELVNYLLERRDSQEKKLSKLLQKDLILEIRRRLKRAEAAFDIKTCRDPLVVARAMLAQIDASNLQLGESALHHYRILSKRARYTAEFSEPSTEQRKFVANVKRVQDVLGDWHDWSILSESAAERLGEVQESALVAELRNVTGAKFRRALAALTQIRVDNSPLPKRLIPAHSTSSSSPKLQDTAIPAVA